jgi:hypothetical protein
VWDSVGVWPLGLCAQPAPPYPVPKASEPQPRALDTLPTGGCSAAPPLLRGSGAVMEATREGCVAAANAIVAPDVLLWNSRLYPAGGIRI